MRRCLSVRIRARAASLALVALLTGALRAAAQAPPSGHSSAGPARYIDGVPDTGQFLADTVVVATFDAKKFTVRNFVYTWYSSDPTGRPSPDSLGRVKFLNTLIQKEILGSAARKAGYNIGYEGRVQMRQFSQRILANALFQRDVLDSLNVSEADIQHVYAQLALAPHLRRIVFADRATADRVRLQLLSGRISWSDAVKKYSKARDTRGPDGDFGFVVRTTVGYELGELLWALKPSEISQVFEDTNGPQIVQCVEIRRIAPPSLDAVRTTIERQIRESRAQLYARRMQELLASHIGLVPDTANIRWACMRFPDPRKTSEEEGTTTLAFDASDPDVPASDTARVLARWKGGQISLGQFVYAYTATTPLLRPAANTPEQLTTQVANVVLEPYKEKMAIDRGYDKDSTVVAEIDKRYERLLVERMYSDSVLSKVIVTRDERRKEYDAHLADYVEPERRYFATILRKTQGQADSLAAQLKAGRGAADVLAADSLQGVKSGMVQSMTTDDHGPFRKIVFEELKPGGITTLNTKEGNVIVVQLLTVKPARQFSFEEASDSIDDLLHQRKAEDVLKALIDRLGRSHTFTTHPELVMRIRLLDPAA